MEGQGKKVLSIVFAVVALIVAGIVISKTFSGSSKNAEIHLLCKSCGEMEISPDDFREMMNQPDGMMPPILPMMGGPMLLNCPECGQKTCAVARKCEKCEKVFVPGMAGDQSYPDRCPGCGYSVVEEAQKAMSR